MKILICNILFLMALLAPGTMPTLELALYQEYNLPAGKYRLVNREIHAIYLNTVTPSVTGIRPGTDTLIFNDTGRFAVYVNNEL